MSHFTVTVLISAATYARYNGAIETALANMLAPYEEGTADKRYLEFQDKGDEVREQYETGTTERIRMPDGALLYPWDDRFRKPGSFGFGNNTHEAPPDLERVNLPFKDLYASAETFAKDYHEYEVDEQTGRIGYMSNPKKTWDWWAIGGRWANHWPLRCFRPKWNDPVDHSELVGEDDVARVEELSLEASLASAAEKAGEFYDRWTAWLANPTGDYDSPRSHALRLGLLRVEQGPAEAGPGEQAIPWSTFLRNTDDARASWTDIARALDRETFLREYGFTFNPLGTYALLDDDGWHAPGKMGWFGCSSDTPEEYLKFESWFMDRLKAAKPDDVLVCVDCHI